MYGIYRTKSKSWSVTRQMLTSRRNFCGWWLLVDQVMAESLAYEAHLTIWEKIMWLMARSLELRNKAAFGLQIVDSIQACWTPRVKICVGSEQWVHFGKFKFGIVRILLAYFLWFHKSTGGGNLLWISKDILDSGIYFG